MPTFTEAAGSRLARNGFTLVELMVVVAVMGLLAGAVVLTVGAPGSGPTESATRFAVRLAAARDEAILTGRPISSWVSPSGYGFDRYGDGHWEPMTDKPFEGDDWDEGTQVAFASDAGGRARVRFDSLGLADSQFALRVTRDGRAATVRIAPTGEVTVD